MHARVVGPEGRTDRAREPVERDVCQHLIAADGVLGAAAMIGPGEELLDDPRRKPDGGVSQRESEGLRAGALDPLVAGYFFQEIVELSEIRLLGGGWILQHLRIAPD